MAGLLAVLPGERRVDRPQRRVLYAAEFEGVGAALAVGAAWGQVLQVGRLAGNRRQRRDAVLVDARHRAQQAECVGVLRTVRSEEHTSELQSLMRISYAVFCLKKNTTTQTQ